MLCPNCGKEVGDSLKLCPSCRVITAAESDPRSGKPSRPAPEPVDDLISEFEPGSENFAKFAGFGGFWLRFFAYLIDLTILTLPAILIGLVVAPFLLRVVTDLVFLIAPSSFIFAMLIAIITTVFVSMLIQAAISFLYFPLFESSGMQATPGKWIFKLLVVNESGEQLPFGQAMVRNLARWAPIAPAFAGLIIAIFLSNLFKMHVPAAATLSIGILVSSMLAFIHYPLAGLTAGKQALHDFIAHTLVVRREQMSPGETICKILAACVVFVGIQVFCPAVSNRKESRQSNETVAPFTLPNRCSPGSFYARLEGTIYERMIPFRPTGV